MYQPRTPPSGRIRSRQRNRQKRLFAELLEPRRLLAASPPELDFAGVDVPQSVFQPDEIAAFEAAPFASAQSTKTITVLEDAAASTNLLTFVLDFKESSQGNTTDIFGNVISTFDVTSYGFAAADFDTVANAVLAEVKEDFFDELVGTVAGPAGQDLQVNFIVGDIGMAPPGVTEYYYVQIGTGTSGPHSGGTLGVAGGSVVRSSAGTGPNNVQIGDVVSSVFTDAIGTLGGLSPSNALTTGNLVFTTNAISGTASHEIGHTLSLSHLSKAGSVQPTASASPIMGTGAVDLPNNDRIGDREFSISGVDGSNGNAPRQQIQQLVDAVGLHTTSGVVLVESGGSTDISESGTTDTYDLSLLTVPSGQVDITVSTDAQTEVSSDGVSFFPSIVLSFTTTSAQTVTVRAIDDLVVEGTHTGTITQAITSTADAANYPTTMSIPDVVANIDDNESVAITSLTAIDPLGSLIFDPPQAGVIAVANEIDEFVISLDPGQTISVVLQSDPALQGSVELRAPGGGVLGTATAGAAGDATLIQIAPAAVAGQYSILVSGAASTVGAYTVEVTLNAAIENETVFATSNDSLATAQDIDASFISLGGGLASRGAVLGTGGNSAPPVQDWYGFSVGDGQSFSLAYTAIDSFATTALELYDAAETLLATGLAATNLDQVINNFLDSTVNGSADTYFARVVNGAKDYSLIITLSADFDTEFNSTFNTAQDLAGVNQSVGHVGQAPGAALDLLTTFPGPDATGFIPPDPTLAVGTNQIVAAVNTDIAIYDKATGNELFIQNMNGSTGFFGSVGATTTVFDPWIIYDDDSQRFFVVAIDTASNIESNVFLAVSKTSTPTGGADWYKYKIDFTHDPVPLGLGTGPHFPDYEKMGINDDAIFISGNYFPLDTGSGVYAGITAIAKAPLLNGAGANVLYEDFFNGFSVFPLNQFSSGSTQYFAEEKTNSIRIHAVTDVLGTPTRSTFDLTVPTFAQPVDVPQSGGGTPADSVSSRIMTGVWRNGSAWFAHSITDPAIGDGEDVVRWYQVATNNFPTNNPTLVQSGNVDPGPGVHAWMPAIAVDGSDNMALGFALGGPSQFYSAGFTGRLATDPLGSTTSPVNQYVTGLANYVAEDSSSRNRWGDYSGLAIDPVDDATFWVFNEYASNGNTWDTQIGSFQLNPIAESDYYTVQVNNGDVLGIETFTPFDGPDSIVNLLNPLVELYAPDGTLLAIDDNGAADGRNALLSHTATQTGTYRVRVVASAGSDGEYLVSATGATGTDPALTVIDTNPDNTQVVTAVPATYSVQFSESIDLSTIDAADLFVNGVAATAVVAVSGNTLEFTVAASVDVGDGSYSVSMATAAVADLQGNPLTAALIATFIVDGTGPVISATSWNGAAFPTSRVFAPGPLTMTATLSEDLFIVASARQGPFTPGADDFLLIETITSQLFSPDRVNFDNITKIVTAEYLSPLPEGNYTLALLSGDGAFEDQYGNDLDGEPIGAGIDGAPTGDGVPGGGYFIDFTVDAAASTPLSFVRLDPLGGLVASSLDNSGVVDDVTDKDSFSFFAEAGETISAVAFFADTARIMTIELVGQSATLSNPVGASSVVLPPIVIPADGVYEVRVGGDGALAYGVDVYRNTALEIQVGDTADGAELAIDDSFLQLGSGRYAVVGTSIATSGSRQFVKSNDPAGFVDISATGTALNLTDDGASNILTTRGNAIFPAGTVSVSNNGGIQAGGGNSLDFQNLALPSVGLGNVLLPFWDDIDSDTGNVYWQELQVGGVDALIVQWDNRPHFSNVGSATFQLQLFATGSTLVRYAYKDVDFGSPADDGGASATIGYQQNDTTAVQFSFDTASVVAGDLVDLIDLPATLDIDEYTIDLTAKVGEPVDVILRGLEGIDFSVQTLQLFDPNGAVVATAVANPLAVPVANYDLGILDHIVADIGNNIYTLRISSAVSGQYALVVTDRLAFDSEPNNDAVTDSLRSLTIAQSALGYLQLEVVGQVEPDLFAVDTVLNNAVAGVTLSNNVGGGSIYAANATFTAPTGARVFAAAIGADSGFRETSNEFRADFDQLTRVVSIDAGSDDPSDVTRLRAYNANDVLIAEVTSASLASGQSETLTIQRPKADIAYVVAGGVANDVSPIDNLQFDNVGDTFDHYAITLAAGQRVVVSTATPLDNVGRTPLNDLDPELSILGTDKSTVLLTDLDSLDTKNAQLSFTASAAGTYYVRVAATSGGGEYLVNVAAPPPGVESVAINDAGASRSQVTSLTVTFDVEVDHAALATAFAITNLDTSVVVSSLSVGTPADVGGKTVVELTFASGVSVFDRVGTGQLGNSLDEGKYRLDISAGQVQSAATGETMSAGYVFGADAADRFFRKYGDNDGSDLVDLFDFAAFRGAFAKSLGDPDYNAGLDSDGNQIVNLFDFAAFRNNFGK